MTTNSTYLVGTICCFKNIKTLRNYKKNLDKYKKSY